MLRTARDPIELRGSALLMPQPVLDRFRRSYVRLGSCWLWIGPMKFMLNGRDYHPRELAKEWFGTRKRRERCDNTRCIAPRHTHALTALERFLETKSRRRKYAPRPRPEVPQGRSRFNIILANEILTALTRRKRIKGDRYSEMLHRALQLGLSPDGPRGQAPPMSAGTAVNWRIHEASLEQAREAARREGITIRQWIERALRVELGI